MNILGVHIQLMLGISPAATPAPVPVMEALESVEVTHSDTDRSGFQLTFAIGRSGPFDLVDFKLVAHPLLQLNARCCLLAYFNGMPEVISDGIVTNRQVIPGDDPGQGRLVLTGTDVTHEMDKISAPSEHPALNHQLIATFLTAQYPQIGLVPNIQPPPFSEVSNPVEAVPVQNETDLEYLVRLAALNGFTFYVEAGPVPLVNTAYFGSPVKLGLQQKALNVNMGHATNVTNVSFSNDAGAPERVLSHVLDPVTGQSLPVASLVSTRPPLGAVPDYVVHAAHVRQRSQRTSGRSYTEALGRAQAHLDSSVDDGVIATGTLDTLRYNGLLKARSRVDLRGAGFSFDGTYRVRRVQHQIKDGEYTQNFTLSRHDIGALVPLVRVA